MDKGTPASSTPGFWKRCSEERPKETPGVPSPVLASELTENDQSTILESSEAGDCSTTVQWDPSMNDTTMQELPDSQSPIAGRTRSHDGSLASLTSFRIGLLTKDLKEGIAQVEQQDDLGTYTMVSDDGTYTMISDDIDVIEGGLNASKYQPGYETDIKQTKNLLKCFTNLDNTHTALDDILNSEEIERDIQAYRSFNNTRMLRTADIEYPEGFKKEDTENGVMLGVTYIRKNEEVSRALDSTMVALKSVEEVDLKKLPLEVLEKLIMLLVNHGIECQERIQKDGSLLEQMDCDLFGLAGTHEKLQAVHSYCMELLKNLKEARERNEIISAELDRVKEEGQPAEALEVGESTKRLRT